MNIRITFLGGGLLIAGGAMAFPTMQYVGKVDGRNVKMSLNSGSSYQSVFAGELKVKVNHAPSLSEIVTGYCADPHTVMMTSGSWDITITNTTDIASVGSKIGHMVNTFAPALLANGSDTNAMALQVAIWEVLVETSGTYNVTSGLFRAKQADGDPFSATELTAINGFLNSVGTGVATYYKSGLDNNGCDPASQSILTPVPEPASIGVLAVGAMALLRRRRNR